jgi:hypothetical protein
MKEEGQANVGTYRNIVNASNDSVRKSHNLSNRCYLISTHPLKFESTCIAYPPTPHALTNPSLDCSDTQKGDPPHIQ